MDLYFFGGSFDPPHLGHKEIINYFIDKSDMLILCPSYKSPFKNSGPIASFLQRKKMLEMMILPNKKLSIIDYENNNKVSYTIDTVKYIKSIYSGYQIHLIIGADQLNEFHLWKDYKHILDLVTLQVVARPGDQIIDNNINFVHTKIINVDASSSFIRKNIFDINEISGMLDQSVLKYINSKKLYN